MESNWKNYFTFTRKERIGIYVLLTLIGIIALLPRFFNAPDPSKAVIIEALKLERAQPEPTAYSNGRKPGNYQQSPDDDDGYYRPQPAIQHATLFPFDPNTLDAAGWRKLGLPERTIRTIQNYTAKGGRFRQPGDLQKMYSLKPADFTRLQPYIRIVAPAPVVYAPKAPVTYVKAPPTIIDINQADTQALIALPGIGSKLANRIIHFREKLGGFYSVEQIGETFGLPDSTFQLIKARLRYTPTALHKVNINTADANTLKQHPYIRWNIANAIVQYRQQHGAFATPDALQQIALITPEVYQKIAAYITTE